MENISLQGHKVKLVPMSEQDRELFITLATDAEVMRFVGDLKTKEEAIADFEALPASFDPDGGNWFMLSIRDKESEEVYGDVAIKMVDKDAKKCEVGYMVKPSAQGQGIGTEALNLMLEYAFGTLAINKVVAYCEVPNTASWRGLEKCGLKREGELKQNAFIGGKLVDDYIYGLCFDDYNLKS